MKFDEFLGKVGDFGPYQKRVYFLIGLTAVLAGYQAMSPVFLLEMNKYRCKIPTYENDTYSVQSPFHAAILNQTVPLVVDDKGETTYSECYLYEPGGNGSQYRCTEWVYDTSVIQSTGFIDFNMVCENEMLRSHSNMIDFAGALCGSLMMGPVGDRFGRKKVLMLTFMINFLGTIALSQSRHFVVFAVFNFFVGLTGRVMFMLGFVFALEFVGPSKRTAAGVCINFFWTTGMFLLTGVAYLVRKWRHLLLAIGCPSILVVSFWWLVPESPRWLMSRGRRGEAMVTVRKIANSNGAELDHELLEQINANSTTDHQLGIRKVIVDPRLAKRVVIIFGNWFTINLVYYGLSLNIGNLSGDLYFNFFLSCAMELAAYITALVLLTHLGRKTLHCGGMLVGGIACLVTILPVLYRNSYTEWTLIALAMVGKFGATVSFAVIYIFSAELFPTVVRQSAIGSCAFFEGIAGMASPYIADLGIHVKGPLEEALPLIVFGTLTVLAGCSALLLPETRDRKMPETVEDAILLERRILDAENDSESDKVRYQSKSNSILLFKDSK